MSNLWNFLFYQPLLNSLIFLYQILGNNFGWAIIALTLIIRIVLLPLALPSLRAAQLMKKIQPELDGLKKKFKDKRKLQEEQLKLYRKHGINPAAGCLPNLLQFLILIALYRVFIHFIQTGMIDGTEVKMNFLWLDLAKPDPFYLLPVLAGVSQLVLTLMMAPAKTKKAKTETEEMAQTIQKQMIFMMPLMTVLIASKLPSGLALYWLTTTLFSLGQQRLLK